MSSRASMRFGSSLTSRLRATASGTPCFWTMSSTRASICQTTIRSVIWPMARVTEMAASSVSLPSRTRSTMVDRADWSRSVKATSSSPRLGKPRARQSFLAESSESPAPAATSRRRSLRSPPSSRASRALAASRSADIVPVGGAAGSAASAAAVRRRHRRTRAGSAAGSASAGSMGAHDFAERGPRRRCRRLPNRATSSGSRGKSGAARSMSWWTFSAFISSTFSRLPRHGLARVVRHAIGPVRLALWADRRWRQA